MKKGDYVKAIPNEKWLFPKEEVVSNSETGILLSVDRDQRAGQEPGDLNCYYKIQLDDDYGIFHSGDYDIEVLSSA